VEPLYLRAEDVAELLQVSKSHVFRLAKHDKTMPVLVLGGVVRFPRERLLVWLRTRERGAVARPRVVRTVAGARDGADGHADGHTAAGGGAAESGGVN